MRFLVKVCLCLAILLGSMACLTALGQPYETDWAVVRPGVVSATARQTLTAAWNDSLLQNERAYCGAWDVLYTPDGVPVLVIRSVRRAFEVYATPMRVRYACRMREVAIHTHPPNTCYADAHGAWSSERCSYAGPQAFQCFPSPLDVRSIRARGDPFGVVQCGPDQFVFFQPLPR